MCKVITLKNNIGQNFQVADIKSDYVKNIIERASECKNIEKVYLFGSSTESRCKEESDVDIAVFGDYVKSKMYKMAGFRKFCNGIYSFTKKDDFQDYDILYFKSGTSDSSEILNDIYSGELIYVRG